MDGGGIIFLIILCLFISVSIFHIRIRKKCIYPVSLTRPRLVLMIAVPPMLLIVPYTTSKEWYYYLLTIVMGIAVGSVFMGQGISEKGIHYHGHSRSIITRLARWEDIGDIKFDTKKNKLKSFRYKTKYGNITIFPDQYYGPDRLDEIKKYIEDRQENKN